HEFLDEAVVALDRPGQRLEQRVLERPDLLRIEPLCQRREAGEISEEDGDLPPVGFARRRLLRLLSWRLGRGGGLSRRRALGRGRGGGARGAPARAENENGAARGAAPRAGRPRPPPPAAAESRP